MRAQSTTEESAHKYSCGMLNPLALILKYRIINDPMGIEPKIQIVAICDRFFIKTELDLEYHLSRTIFHGTGFYGTTFHGAGFYGTIFHGTVKSLQSSPDTTRPKRLFCWHSATVLTFTALAFTILLSTMLPFAVLHRTISASASFILLERGI